MRDSFGSLMGHAENDEFEAIMAALGRGAIDELEELSVLVVGFPAGHDPLLGDRWLSHAISSGAVASVRWMLAQGLDLSYREEDGYTPLHHALERSTDRHEVLSLLLSAGAPVNAKGINDWTPAHLAAARDDVAALQLLVRHGADLTIRTEIDNYATPIEEARALGRKKAVQYLETLQ